MRFRLKAECGTHRRRLPNGKMELTKAGGIVDCEREELGAAIDKFVQLDPDQAPKEEEPRAGLRIKDRRGGGFDVENTKTGRALNEIPLTKDEADNLAASIFEDDEEEKDGGE